MLQRRVLVKQVLLRSIPAAILAVAMIVVALLVHLKREPSRSVAESSDAVLVEAAPVVMHDEDIAIDVSGVVVPYREVAVAAEVSGRVEWKSPSCRAGRVVREGEPLIRFDARDYQLARDEAQAALKELEAEIASTQKSLEIARQQLAVARREYDRNLQLRSSLSEAELDRSERDYLAAQSNVTSLENQLQVLEARKGRLESALRKAQLDLERTEIRSPVSGVVVRDLVEQDAFVQRGAQVVVIEDTSRVEVQCSLRKEELLWLWLSRTRDRQQADRAVELYEVPRAQATVIAELGDYQFSWRGRLERYEGIGLDPKTRSVPCRVLVEDPTAATIVRRGTAGDLQPPPLVRGMYVTVQITARPDMPMWRIPQAGLRPGEAVWLARDGRLARRLVRVVETLDGEVVVLARGEPFAPDDRVVVSPLDVPYEGMPIREEPVGDEPLGGQR